MVVVCDHSAGTLAMHVSNTLGLKKQEVFPDGPVVRTLGFYYQNPRSIPGWGTEIPQAMRSGRKKKKSKEIEKKMFLK